MLRLPSPLRLMIGKLFIGTASASGKVLVYNTRTKMINDKLVNLHRNFVI